MFFYKTLYYWYFSEFLPKKHKTTQDFKDLTAYFAELAVIGALMGLGVSKLIDVFCEIKEAKDKMASLKQQNQSEASGSQAE